MFRKLNTLTSFGIESTTRKILDEIICAGEKLFQVELPIRSSIANYDQIVKIFSQALDQALQENGFSYQEYQAMNDDDKNLMRQAIAYYFVTKYGIMEYGSLFGVKSLDLVFAGLGNVFLLESDRVPVNHPSIHSLHLLDVIILLPKIFGNLPLCNEFSIQKNLVNDLKIPLAAFVSDRHEKQLATLALGYADQNSIFSKCPKELVQYIGSAMNAVQEDRKLIRSVRSM